MADLDSFFAKKDKKKVKGKKFTTTDEIARRLEESEKKEQMQVTKPKILEPIKKVEESENDAEPGAPPVVVEEPPPKTKEEEEEEWNDYRDDQEKDLTDLKISKLQIELDEDEGGGSGDDDGEKGEGGDKRDKSVWKTESVQQPPPPAPVAVVEPEEKIPVGRGALNSSYVPPHLRNASPLPKGGPTRRSKAAPDINNEMAFPSLSDAQTANPMGPWGRKKYGNEGFENVKHGSTRYMAEDHAPPKLSTANRFDALTDQS